MSIRESLARHVFLPVHERLRGRSTIDHWRKLRRNEELNPSDLAALRLRKLRTLVAHCIKSVPYYREIFREAGVTDPQQFELSDLARLPILEKDILRARSNALIARGLERRLIRYSTGGSTGSPLIFYTDLHRESCLNAQKLRARSWFGVQPGDRQVDFWGSPIEMSRQNHLRRIKDRLFLNQVVLSAANLTEERLSEYVRSLRTFRPRLIYGYATVIYRIAVHLVEHDGALGDYRPNLISCTAEMLSKEMRDLIQSTFMCPVANEYGSRDGGLLAHECPHGRLHVLEDHVILEISRAGSDGIGDIVVTNLDAFGMPFIRYRLGDRGKMGDASCACGLPFGTMSDLQGRSNDFMVGRGGRLVHNSSADYVLRPVDAFKQYQLRQRSDHSFDLYFVPKRELTAAEEDLIRSGLIQVLGERVRVDFHICVTIAPEESGKYRWLVSEAEE